MTIAYHRTFEECPSNPARVTVPTGEIEINLERWKDLSEQQRLFVLMHEEGHYARQTFDEQEADDYALRQMALKKPYSLQNHIKAVREISYNNPKRVRNAQVKALQIAASDGSQEAKALLDKLQANADGVAAKIAKRSWVKPVLLIVVLVVIIRVITR